MQPYFIGLSMSTQELNKIFWQCIEVCMESDEAPPISHPQRLSTHSMSDNISRMASQTL